MIDLPGAPHEKYERQAFQTAITLVGVRLLVWVAEEAAAARSWHGFLDSAGVYLTALALFAGAFWAGLFILRQLAGADTESLRAHPLPAFPEPLAWTPILNGLPNVVALGAEERQRLGGLMQRFLAQVGIEGCNGIVVDDRIRLTIAAEACLLALNLPPGCFGPLKTVLVYPTAFVPRRFSWVSGLAPDEPHAALGESWDRGTVILAWDDVVGGVEEPTDGQNVVLHEFAHQLDSAGGRANGVPPLGSPHRYAAWTQMLERNFARFNRDLQHGRPTVLDPYGATNEAEFFAVATETFFERPHALQRQYPELFEELRRYYRQDPSLRTPAEASPTPVPSNPP